MTKLLLPVLIGIFCFTSMVSAQSVVTEEGLAAYYSSVFQGKKTASGERYDKDKLTGAHKTLTFGTKVKVTDLKNNKSVIIVINDRGPYSKNRIIDLSYAAAQEIDLIKAGISPVRLEVIE